MNTSYMVQLIKAIRDMADIVDRIAPRRPVLEKKLLELIRTPGYTWKWHPGTSRITASLTAGYRVTLAPSEDATVVTFARKQPNDAGGLTEATFPEMYVSLDVWYWAYNQAVKDDGLTLDDILSGHFEVEGAISPEDINNLVKAGLVRDSYQASPLPTKVIDEEMTVAEKNRCSQVQANVDAIEEIRAVLARNAFEAGDGGDEG